MKEEGNNTIGDKSVTFAVDPKRFEYLSVVQKLYAVSSFEC